MGNKSKKNNRLVKTVAGKLVRVPWKRSRDLISSRLPRASNGSMWHGLAPESVAPFVYKVLPSGRKERVRATLKRIA